MAFINNRKGQESGSNVAILIAIITVFIVLYLAFLPGDVRDDVLNGNVDDPYDNGNGATTSENRVDFRSRTIIEKSPGRLDYLSLKECDKLECTHEISSFTLFKTTEASMLADLNPIVVQSNIAKNEIRTVSFDLLDAKNTDNVFLTFTTYTNRGLLEIKLNGKTIYEKDIEDFNPKPVKLPASLLARSNTLEFSVSPVGWEFWKTNEYKIENLQIVGDVTDTSRQKSSNVFYIRDGEYYNLDKGRLKFSPDCKTGSVGLLEIMLNSHQLFLGIPDCGTMNEIEFSTGYLNKGENQITFSTDAGSYLLDIIQVRTDLKDIDYPVYYFDFDDEDLDALIAGDASVTATFELITEFNEPLTYEDNYNDYAEYREDKYKVVLIVNGHKIYIESYDSEFERDIPITDLRKKDNWIKIEPNRDSIEISKFRLKIIESEDSSDYRYYCGSDTKSIYLKHDGDSSNTGWTCEGKSECHMNYQVYDTSESRRLVMSNLCDYGY